MKKGFCLLFIAVVVGLVMLSSKAWATPLEDRVAVLEGKVTTLETTVAGQQPR